MEWQPTASIDSLKKRAAIIKLIHAFFYERGVLEVETPLLSHATITDPHIESVTATCMKQRCYLQTSPEFAMKRLLAAGSGPIYQITKAFRDKESGRLHNPEFTLLEWYHLEVNHHQLMDEVEALVQSVLQIPKAQRFTYQAIFEKHCGFDPHEIDAKSLATFAASKKLSTQGVEKKDDWLSLFMTHIIEPQLIAPTFIYDYPVSQAALAKVDNNVAQRFELYVDGVELANGFCELTDAFEQRARFEEDLITRKAFHQPLPPVDERFLEALKAGLPPCSGVALGIDRLVMLALNASALNTVISFDFERA